MQFDCIEKQTHKNHDLFYNSGVEPAFLIMTKSLKTVNYIRNENGIFVSLENS